MTVTDALYPLISNVTLALIVLVDLAGLVLAVVLRQRLGGRSAGLGAAGFGVLAVGHGLNWAFARLLPSVMRELGTQNLPTVLITATTIFGLLNVVGTLLVIFALILRPRAQSVPAGPSAGFSVPPPAAFAPPPAFPSPAPGGPGSV